MGGEGPIAGNRHTAGFVAEVRDPSILAAGDALPPAQLRRLSSIVDGNR